MGPCCRGHRPRFCMEIALSKHEPADRLQSVADRRNFGRAGPCAPFVNALIRYNNRWDLQHRRDLCTGLAGSPAPIPDRKTQTRRIWLCRPGMSRLHSSMLAKCLQRDPGEEAFSGAAYKGRDAARRSRPHVSAGAGPPARRPGQSLAAFMPDLCRHRVAVDRFYASPFPRTAAMHVSDLVRSRDAAVQRPYRPRGPRPRRAPP